MNIYDLKALCAAEAIRNGKRVAIVGLSARGLADMVDRIGNHYERLTIDRNRGAGETTLNMDRVRSVDRA